MATGATTRRVLEPARLLLVIAAIVGVVGMHALVLGTPTAAHTVHSAHTAAVAPAVSGSADIAPAPVVAPSDAAGAHGSGHDPADHTGLAHLCLALAAAIFLLLVRRFVGRATLAGPAGPVMRVRATAARWTRPPPDLVGTLCVSRT